MAGIETISATECAYSPASEIEADAVRSLLEQAGIPSVVVSFRSGAYPGVVDRSEWGEVRVAKEDLSRAKKLLAELRPATDRSSERTARAGPETSSSAGFRWGLVLSRALLLASLVLNGFLMVRVRELSKTVDTSGRLIWSWDDRGSVRSFDVHGELAAVAIDEDGDRRYEVLRTIHRNEVVAEAFDRDGDDRHEEYWRLLAGRRVARFEDRDGDGAFERSVRVQAWGAKPSDSFPQSFDTDGDGLPDKIVCQPDTEALRTFHVDQCYLGAPQPLRDFNAHNP